MYAVIAASGKQYKVTQGALIKLDKLAAEIGDAVEFPVLLLASDESDIQIGAPYLNRKVKGSVVEHGRGDKIKIIKFRRRKHHRKQMGHRQDYTAVQITEI